MSKRFAILLAIASLFCFATTASAAVACFATPPGANCLFNGSSGNISVTLSSITWNSDSAALPTPGPPWNGDVATGTSLSFAGCSGVLGSTGCLFQQEGIEINNANPLTATTALPEDYFLRFESNPNLDFKLTGVLPGSSNYDCNGLAIGASCSIFAGSPIILTQQSGGGTGATLNLVGLASDNGGVSFSSSWTGYFSTTLGQSPAQLQALFCPGDPSSGSPTCMSPNFGATVNSSNSGSFQVNVIPEPNSFVLMSGGIVSLFGLLRLRKRLVR